MKKKSRLLILSHRPGRVCPTMGYALFIGLLSMILLLSPVSTYAAGSLPGNDEGSAPQQVKVTGTITDATTQEPLVGVNVVLEGTTIGVMTDLNGKYSLSVPNLSGTLQISYIGYVAQNIPINGMTNINVSLASDVQALEEVVVTGYGTVRKTDLTGSVSSIKTEQLLQLPTQRVDQAIQGRATGVFVMNTDGSPGGNTLIRIRGNNSINGGNDPLIIVDGLQGLTSTS
ncbi:MAG: carboxypeptidase-like regulatory domain-containing protein [Bacteroidales bacterium]|nr:carboxypeptidase-like regulatory domain-containing protein [Bacteroidales bacterium]